MPKPNESAAPLSITLPAGWVAAIDCMAEAEGRNRSEMIRELMRAELAQRRVLLVAAQAPEAALDSAA